MFLFAFLLIIIHSGEYISLGYHEQDDLKVVIQYLLETNKVSGICKFR